MRMFKKRIAKAVMWICVIALIIALVPAVPVSAQELAGVVLAPAEMRTAPGNSYDVIATLSKGTRVTVLSEQNGWKKVALNGKSGYCRSSYIGQDSSLYATGKTTDTLNVRSGPGMSYSLLEPDALEKDTEVTIIDNSDPNWAKVKLSSGKIGYYDKDYLQITSTSAPQPPAEQKQYAVLSDPAALRSGPGAAYSVVQTIEKGAKVTVTDSSNPAWYKILLADNTTAGYCSVAFLTIVPYEEPDTDTTGADEVIPLGKTLYIKDESNWSSSNESVVRVDNGLLEAVGMGRATVTSDGHSRVVAVTKAEAVKMAYASPNAAPLNSDVTFFAVTDTTRTSVKFEVNGQTIMASDRQQDGSTYVWTGTCRMDSSGAFNVKTYSEKNGKWDTCDNGNTTAYVTSVSDAAATYLGEHRTSDAAIDLIKYYEGYSGGNVYPDKVAGGILTLGYGYTISSGEQFYNHLTEKEAYALLVQTVNKKFYSTSVNQFLKDNSIKCNQQQFDALVSFTYNLGSGWMYHSDFSDDLLNAYDPGSIPKTTVLKAKITSTDGLNLRSSPTAQDSSNIKYAMRYGDTVTVLDSGQFYNNNWYHILAPNGTDEGYCDSSFLSTPFEAVSEAQGQGQRDLACISPSVFINEIIQWHKSGGNCLWGLLYRRFDEAEMFLYGDYTRDQWHDSTEYPGYSINGKHAFPIPSCFN